MWQYIYDSINTLDINTINTVYRLFLGMLLGAIVGYERRLKGQTAGVRTFSLIAMGATLCMIISVYVPQEYLGLKNGDPSRIAAQVVSGVGFLGAGTIIQMKGSVRGLTTAAGIWMVSAIGMAVGLGMYVVAVVATGLILFILILLERIENYFTSGKESRIIIVNVSDIIDNINDYAKELNNSDIHLTNYYVDYDYALNMTKLRLVVLASNHFNYMKVFEQLRKIHPTTSISLDNQL